MHLDIPVFVSGLQGRMAGLIAEAVAKDEHFDLLPAAMTSARNSGTRVRVGDKEVQLISDCPPDLPLGTIAVDYTTPQSSEINVRSYIRQKISFVMGTTGGNREVIEDMVRNSEISAVIAPNMAVSIVEIQDELTELLKTFPDHFRGWHMQIRESHQAEKKDVSGTALTLKAQLEKLGALMDGEIESIRDPEIQRQLGIQNVDGHAYHWISLSSPTGEIKEFKTAIEGRRAYVEGTLIAARFLAKKMREGSRGEVFSMSDVIRDRKNLLQ